MKIRNGFVSNSSSSSFVVFGRSTTVNEIDDPHVKILGTGLGDGMDYFRPTQKMIAYIKEHGFDKDKSVEFIYDLISFSEESIVSIDQMKSLLKEMESDPRLKTLETFSFDKDMHSTESMETFLWRYAEEENENGIEEEE